MKNDDRLYHENATVLHVTEAFNGGIHTALTLILKEFPKVNHILLVDSHSYDPISSNLELIGLGAEIITWEKGFLRRTNHFKKIYLDRKPYYIHLHSSWAGFFGRLLPLNAKIFYSPHAFAFQRKDVHPVKRLVFAFLELFMQLNTDQNIAFWPVEYQYLKKFKFTKRKSVFSDILIRNFLIDRVHHNEIHDKKNRNMKLICVGRFSRQKDPKFFIDTINFLREMNIPIEVTWIGGGNEEIKKLLIAAKIDVIPWLPYNQLKYHLSSSDLTVITSAWESGPLTVYESLAAGTPVAWRSIAANQYLGWNHGKNPKELARTIEKLLKENKLKLTEIQLNEIRNRIKEYTSEEVNSE